MADGNGGGVAVYIHEIESVSDKRRRDLETDAL